MTAGVFVAWSLDVPPEELASFVLSAVGNSTATGVDAFLTHPDAVTVSLFRYDDGTDPRLVWYVEHEENPALDDPATVIRDNSPLFERGLDELLKNPETPLVIADEQAAVQELVHAMLPGRPRTYPDQRQAVPIFCGDPVGEGDPETEGDSSTNDHPDVVPVRLAIRPGLGSALARLFGWLFHVTPDWLESKFEAWTEPILEAEGMYTETLLLERDAGRYYLWWYMEAGAMDQVYDAYYESDQRIARYSEYVLGLVLAHPEQILGLPGEGSDFDLIAHAVSPDR